MALISRSALSNLKRESCPKVLRVSWIEPEVAPTGLSAPHYAVAPSFADWVRGIVAITVVPSPGLEMMLKRPPDLLIRSDIPERPNPTPVLNPTTKPHPLSLTNSRIVNADVHSSTLM